MRPQRCRDKGVQHEAPCQQPERGLAKRLAQGGIILLKASLAGDHQRRATQGPGLHGRNNQQQHCADQEQRRPPAQARQQPGHGRKGQRTGKSPHQSEHGDAVLIALWIALGQHVEGRLVQRGGHGGAQHHPHRVQHPRHRQLRPGHEAQARQCGTPAHHRAPVAGIDQRPTGVAAGAPHRQAQRVSAHHRRRVPGQLALHGQDEGRKGIVQSRPTQQLADGQGCDGGAITRRQRRHSQASYGRAICSRLVAPEPVAPETIENSTTVLKTGLPSCLAALPSPSCFQYAMPNPEQEKTPPWT